MSEKERIEELKEAYRIGSKNSGFKVGDAVTVLRSAEEGELGWSNVWAGKMSSFIGKRCEIEAIDTDGYGLKISCDLESGYDYFFFPWFVLKKIPHRKAKVCISCNGDDITFDLTSAEVELAIERLEEAQKCF